MAETLPPSEIAREVLLRLAQRRLPPTPGNYFAIYQEIAGTDLDAMLHDQSLKMIIESLPRTTPDQVKLARAFDDAIATKSWPAFKEAVNSLFLKATGNPLHWSGLIRNLLLQLENRSAGLTTAKKREALEHVLNASSNPELLFQRMQSLLRGWAQSPAQTGDVAMTDGVADSSATIGEGVVASPKVATTDEGWRELCATLLQNTVGALLTDSQPLTEEAGKLAAEIRVSVTADQLGEVMAKAKKFSYRVNFVAEDQTEVRATLQKLLQLVIENIGELVIDDKWLHGQIDVISQLLTQQPLNLRQLDDVESRLRDLIVKQSALKQNLTEAQGRLKSMLASFVDRLADFSESTADYQEKIEKCAERITQADTIGELSDVLDDVMRETRGIQINALRSHGELTAMRQRVEESEREISRLQNELAHASEMVRHDPLTGALNRKGVDEAVDREIARVRRHGGPMSVAMLDIDNFKMLNDRLGHDAGDAALVHLTTVVHDTIRPQDTLARYGGEEFVILLPNTGLDDGSNVMVRVQRELTRKFFFYNHEKVLITFSCGVAELMAEEPPEEAIKRADSAMYLAKRMGKNRVVAA